MAILMDPLLVSPPPAAALGAVVPPVVLLHAANASTLTAARAPTLCRFIQSLLQNHRSSPTRPKTGVKAKPSARCSPPNDPDAPLGDRPWTAMQGRMTARGLASGQRAGGRRSDAVS